MISVVIKLEVIKQIIVQYQVMIGMVIVLEATKLILLEEQRNMINMGTK